ncbi:MAG: hypothetical protein J7M14_06430 [Planctomycetes bacterium]|nr:hypothetical protein [Planctomycetota bacterium]
MAKFVVEEQSNWRWWVTPKPLADKPIHRWYIFPHSFTNELVHALIDEWGLNRNDRILDPFVGAGTTLVAAKERGIPANGYDLSPLAVFVTRVKLTNYKLKQLENAWENLRCTINPSQWNGCTKPYPELVKKALPGRLLGAFDSIAGAITRLECSEAERDFFRLALLATLPRYSRAVRTGGWLRWVRKGTRTSSIVAALSARVDLMLGDLRKGFLPRRASWRVGKADARALPDRGDVYSAVITSPPYPNRHDYTRVFGVELMFGFLDWEGTRALRYQSFHSHPEARPDRPDPDGYAEPTSLARALRRIEEAGSDAKIVNMLRGYFLDMYLCLREAKCVCKKGAKIVFVVGNAQYCGQPVPVDELTAEIGEQAGLTCKRLLAVRYRGNSAQQMGEYGRNPSRESVIVFEKQ